MSPKVLQAHRSHCLISIASHVAATKSGLDSGGSRPSARDRFTLARIGQCLRIVILSTITHVTLIEEPVFAIGRVGFAERRTLDAQLGGLANLG